LALRYSYDPLTGRLDVGFNPDEKSSATEAPPRVTPSNSKTVPKAVPQGGSAQDPSKPKELIKPYYLSGEKPPEGIKTKLERVDVDGKMRLARVPILPDLTPEQQARVDEAANAKQFTYGYDPKSGEFATGVIDTPEPEAPVTGPTPNPVGTSGLKRNEEGKLELDTGYLTGMPGVSKPKEYVNPTNAAEGIMSGYDIGNLRREKRSASDEMWAANTIGDKEKARLAGDKLVKIEDEINRAEMTRGANFIEDKIVGGALGIVTGRLSGFNDFYTGAATLLSEFGTEFYDTTQAAVGAGAAAGSALGPAGTVVGGIGGGLIGSLIGSGSVYSAQSYADQYLNSRIEQEELFGENTDTLPLDSIREPSQVKAVLADIAATGADFVLGAAAGKLGTKLIGKSKPGHFVGKAAKRMLPILEAAALGGATEVVQDFALYLGSDQSLNLGNFATPELAEQMGTSFAVGSLMGGGVASTVAGGKAAVDTGSAIKDIIKNRKEARKKPQPEDFLNIDGSRTDIDTADLEGTVLEGEVITPEAEVVAEAKPKGSKQKPAKVEPKVEETPKTEEAPNSVSVWNDYYNNRIEAFEKSQETVRTPSEIYAKGTELGLPVGDIYTRIVGDETSPIDAGTPQVKVANNVIKGVVEAAEAQKFYTDLGRDPEAQELYLDAIEQSQDNPERQVKIEEIRRNFPGTPQTVLDTLKDEDIERLSENLPDTRGQGVQYHGSRSPVDVNTFESREFTYNPDNIYGGDFYTTDAIDVAKGYQRKKQEGITYEVREKAPVLMFDMEDRAKVSDGPISLETDAGVVKAVNALNKFRNEMGLTSPDYQINPNEDYNNWVEWQLDALSEAVKPDGTVSLRDFMDAARETSRTYDLQKYEVQELFDDIIQEGLRKNGFGGMRHAGGKFTGAKAHNVNIYFDPKNQLEITPLNLGKVLSRQTPPVPDVTPAVTEVTNSSGAVDPKAQLTAVDEQAKEMKAEASTGDPLEIPSFLDRRGAQKTVSKDPKYADKPLFAQEDGMRKAVYSEDELVDVRYTGVFPDDTPQEVRDAIQPIVDNIAAISREIGKAVGGTGIGRFVDFSVAGDINPIVREKDGTLRTDTAAGEYNPERDAVVISLGAIVDSLVSGKKVLENKQGVLSTAVHEYIHAADMKGFFGERRDNVFNKQIKDMQQWLIKNTDYGDLMKDLDPANSRKDRAEVIAYYTQNYIETSNSKAASEFRRAFGIPKTQGDKTFLEPTGGLKLWIQKAVDTFRRILEAIRDRIQGLREVNKTVDEFFTGAFAKEADKAYLAALQRQANALYEAKTKQQSLFSLKNAAGISKKEVDPIEQSYKAVKRLSENTQDAFGSFENMLKDPENVKGFGNKIYATLNQLRTIGAQARFDADFAHNLNIGLSVQRDKAEYLRAFGPAIKWLSTLPNRDKYLQIALDLRKQKKSLVSEREDGGIVYKNRKGQNVVLPKSTVDTLREVTKAFSAPLQSMLEVDRARLKNLNTRPNFDIPFDQGVVALEEWLNKAKDTYKKATVKDPVDRAYLDRAENLIDSIAKIESYIKADMPYVPEMRRGNWALSVKDKNGKLIGLYTLEAKGGILSSGQPDKGEWLKLKTEIRKRYRGQDDLVVSSEPFELTKNALAKLSGADKVDLNLIISLVAQEQQGIISTALKAEGKNDIDIRAMLAGKDVAGSVSNAAKASGFGKHLLKSDHIDGALEDWNWVLDSFFNSAASTVSYLKWLDVIDATRTAYLKESPYNTIKETSSPKQRKYLQLRKDLDYMLAPGHDAPRVRMFSYMWGLAFRPSTALIQISPLLNNVPADMVSLGVPVARSYSSLKEGVKYAASFGINSDNWLKDESFFDDKVLDSLMGYYKDNPKMQAYVRNALEKDTLYLNAALTEEALGDIRQQLKYKKGPGGAYKRVADTVVKAGGFMMNAVERSSRTGTYLAFMKEFYGQPERIKRALEVLNKEPLFREFRRFNPQLDDVRAITNYSIQISFGMAEKAARPRFTRGAAGALISPFTGIPTQLWENMIQNLMGIRGKPGVKGSIVGMATMALLFGSRAAIPTFAIFVPTLLELFGEKDEPGELQYKALIADMLGVEWIAKQLGVSKRRVLDMATGGATSAFLGLDISARMGNAMPFSNLLSEVAMGIGKGEFPRVDDLLGIVGSTASSVPNAIGQISSDRMTALEGMALVAPAVLRDILKAANMATSDVIKTASGKPLLSTEDLSTGDIIAQALGFNPKPVQDAQLRNRMDSLATTSKSALKQSYTQRFIALGAKIRRSSDPSERSELTQEYRRLREQFFEDVRQVKKDNPSDYEAYLTPKDIDRMFKEVEKGIEFRLNPESSEGLPRNAINTRKKYRDYFNYD